MIKTEDLKKKIDRRLEKYAQYLIDYDAWVAQEQKDIVNQFKLLNRINVESREFMIELIKEMLNQPKTDDPEIFKFSVLPYKEDLADAIGKEAAFELFKIIIPSWPMSKGETADGMPEKLHREMRNVFYYYQRDKANLILDHFKVKKKHPAPICWLKSEQALRQLIEVLKENGLIQHRETDTILQHFIINGKEPKQAAFEPINWIVKKVNLAYLIETMANKKLISVSNNIWQETVNTHFILKGKPITKMKQTASGYKYNKTRKPHKADLIDSIISGLPE